MSAGSNTNDTDPLGIFDLARIGSHPTAALHAPADRRGRDDNDTLPIRAGSLSGAVHPELDLPILCGKPVELCRGPRWNYPNGALFRLFLDLLHQVSGGKLSHLQCGPV